MVSFSGGKDSTAMLLRMMELGMKIDEVIFCDTYKEFPQMYEHIKKIKQVVEQANIKFTELKSDKSFDYYMFEHQPKRKNKKLMGNQGFSWAYSRNRWCTSKLKIDVIKRHIKKITQTYNIVQYVGIAHDEQYRLKRENNQSINKKYPLVDWKWDEKKALCYCYDKGYDWEGLYNHFNRVSCWCCPLQSLNDLKNLYKYYPKLWKELRQMDEKTWYPFKSNYSVKDLEIRFQLEEEWESKGLKTGRTKAFREELKKRLQRE